MLKPGSPSTIAARRPGLAVARVVGGLVLGGISVLLLLSFHNYGVFFMPLLMPAMWFATALTRSRWVAGIWIAIGAIAAAETAWLFGSGWGFEDSTWLLAPMAGAVAIVVLVGGALGRR